MPFNVLTDIAWKAAFWTEDPSWTPPADGAVVASWRDAGSEAKDATSGASQPTYRASTPLFNGRPTIQFTGSPQYLTTADWTTAIDVATTLTWVVVASGTPNGTSQAFIASNTTGSPNYLSIRNTNQWEMFRGGGGDTGGTADNNPHLIIGKMNGSGGTGTIQVDGILVKSIVGSGSATLPGVSLGAYSTNQRHLIGRIAFAAVFEGTLTTVDEQNLRQWANGLYGINFTDFAADPGLKFSAPAGPAAILGRVASMRRAPSSPVGANHPPNRKFPNDPTTGTMLFSVPGTSMSQVSDYDLWALEGDPAPSVNPTLSFQYPSDITVEAGDLLAVHVCVGGGNALAQTISFTATNGVVLNIPLDSIFGGGTRMELGSLAHSENLNNRFGGMTVGFWKNTTGASVTTKVTVGVTGSINRSVSGTPHRQMSHSGFIWPVVTRGTIAPVYLDGAATAANSQNASSLGLGWQNGTTNARLRKAGTWAWGIIASREVNSMSSLTNGAGAQVVWAFDPVRAGNTTTQYAYAVYRGSLPNTQDGITNRLPAIGSQQSHYLTYELQPETGFYDNDIRNLRKQVTPGEFVKKPVDGSMMAPVSITGPKTIQPQGWQYDIRVPLTASVIMPGRLTTATTSETEGLRVAPYSPSSATEGPLTSGNAAPTEFQVEPILMGPGDVCVLFADIECHANLNVQVYTSSTITSVTNGPGSMRIVNPNDQQTSSTFPVPVVWQLVSNKNGTRAFKGHSIGTSQYGGQVVAYFAYNHPSNGFVTVSPLFKTNQPMREGTVLKAGNSARAMPVVFQNAYPYLAGGDFAILAQGGGFSLGGFVTAVGGSSQFWGLCSSKNFSTGSSFGDCSATNCDTFWGGYAWAASDSQRRSLYLFRQSSLNKSAGTVNPAITYSDFNNSGGDTIWIEIRQAEQAKPKRLVYPGFGTPGGAPGGRLEAFIPGEEVQNALNIYSKQGGVQVQAIGLKVKSGGSWVDATAVWYRDAGVWVVV